MNGNPPVTSAFGVTSFNSSLLNENQREFTQFGVLALQTVARRLRRADCPISPATAICTSSPDPIGDLLFNGIASDVTRQSYTNGIQGDASYHAQRGAYAARRLHRQRRTGLASAIRRWSSPASTCDGTDNGTRRSPSPTTSPKLGWLAGVYVQDEWKITNQLTMNAGLALRSDVAVRQRQPVQPAA